MVQFSLPQRNQWHLYSDPLLPMRQQLYALFRVRSLLSEQWR